jgi:2-O-methyltransferase
MKTNTIFYKFGCIIKDRIKKQDNIPKYKIKKLIRKHSVIVELGANDGADSLKLINIVKPKKLYCFEPHPQAIQKFKQRMKGIKNCELFDYAISNKNGKTDFYLAEGNWNNAPMDWGSSINKPKNITKDFPFISYKNKIKVKTITLDKWAEKQGIEKIDFMWVDIEGAEREFIQGGLKTLKEKVKYLYIEVCDDEYFENEPTEEEIKRMLPNFKIVGRYDNNVLFKNDNNTTETFK